MSEEFAVHLAGFQPGTLLAGYRLEAQVGAGGMAVVFRARDERLGRPVALKIMAPALAADKAYQRRFIAESRAAARVDDPHIIPIYEAGEARGVLFIAMRFVQGGDLGNVLEQEAALPPDRAAGFISQVASALDAAHAAGLVHRDVKPANILVDARAGRPDHAYLSDFGASKGAMLSSVSMAGALTGARYVGTPYYSAPEQIDGLPVDGRADQYALACVAFQLLTGRVPFERDQPTAVMLAHLSAPRPSLVERRSDLPDAVDPVVAKAMAKRPAERYESCGDFADALRDALGLTPYHARGPVTALVQLPPADTPPPSEVSPLAGTPTQTAAPRAAPSRTAAVTPPASAHPATQVAPATPPARPPTVVSAPGEFLAPAPEHPSTEADEVPAPSATPAVGEDGPSAAAEAGGQPDAGVEADAGLGEPAQGAGGPAEASVAIAEAPEPAADPIVEPEAEAPEIAADALDVAAGTPDAPADARVMAEAPADAPVMPEVPAVPADDPAVPDMLEDAPEISSARVPAPATAAANVAEMPAAAVITRPERPEGATGRDTTTVRVRRRHLAVAALVCAVVGAAVAVPLLMRSPASSARSARSPRPVNSPSFSRVALDLPAGDRNDGFVSSLAFSPTSGTLAIAHRAGGICLWDMASGGCTSSLAGAWAVVFSPNGQTLAASDADTGVYANDVTNGLIRLWNVATGNLTTTFSDPSSQGALSLAFSPDGKTLAVGDRNGAAYLWNVATVKLTRAPLIDPSSHGINDVVFSPDGKMLAVGDTNGCTYLWNVATGKLITTLVDPSSQGVDSVAFSLDGKTLATGDDNGHVYLWSAVTWKRTAALKDPRSKGADSVAFSPDGKTLAAGDVNGCTYVWSVATGKLVHAPLIDPSSEGINAVLFSPNGKTLATGDEDGDVYVW